jgi:hypothetical protein
MAANFRHECRASGCRYRADELYDGTFREDWEYVADSGDLDQCNGLEGVTPEYPEGTYHYYITDNYPYIPRCVMGTPDASFRMR